MIGDDVAIEVKASKTLTDRRLKGLRKLHAGQPMRRRIVVSREPVVRRTGHGIEVLPVDGFLRDPWGAESW